MRRGLARSKPTCRDGIVADPLQAAPTCVGGLVAVAFHTRLISAFSMICAGRTTCFFAETPSQLSHMTVDLEEVAAKVGLHR